MEMAPHVGNNKDRLNQLVTLLSRNLHATMEGCGWDRDFKQATTEQTLLKSDLEILFKMTGMLLAEKTNVSNNSMLEGRYSGLDESIKTLQRTICGIVLARSFCELLDFTTLEDYQCLNQLDIGDLVARRLGSADLAKYIRAYSLVMVKHEGLKESANSFFSEIVLV